jgi:hypothetical protein
VKEERSKLSSEGTKSTRHLYRTLNDHMTLTSLSMAELSPLGFTEIHALYSSDPVILMLGNRVMSSHKELMGMFNSFGMARYLLLRRNTTAVGQVTIPPDDPLVCLAPRCFVR